MKIHRSLAVSLLLVACASVASAAMAETSAPHDAVDRTAVQQMAQGQSGHVAGTVPGFTVQRAAHNDAPAECLGPVSFCTPYFGA